MDFYMFFKKYFIFMGKWTAELLYKKWISANQSSIIAFLIIIPMFLVIDLVWNNYIYFVLIVLWLIAKLVLNAIDWIIARKNWDKSKTWMILNVWTDIVPDMFIIYLILSRFEIDSLIISNILIIIFIYFILELLFIFLFNKQNLFYWKDLRTIFYFLIWIILFFNFNPQFLLIYYFIILLVHNVWFFLPKYRN